METPYNCGECGGPAFAVQRLRGFLDSLANWEKELLGEGQVEGIEYAIKLLSSPTFHDETNL